MLQSQCLLIPLYLDVASRGIDIQDVTHVLNFDFPRDMEEYVHRYRYSLGTWRSIEWIE